MNTWVSLILFSAAVMADAAAVDDERQSLEKRAKKITVGMERREAERILPQVVPRATRPGEIDAPPIRSGMQTGSQSMEQYPVSQRFRATIVYDHHGGRGSGDNRVLVTPKIVPATGGKK